MKENCVINPATGRAVKADSRLGKKILQSRQNDGQPKNTIEPKKPKNTITPKRIKNTIEPKKPEPKKPEPKTTKPKKPKTTKPKKPKTETKKIYDKPKNTIEPKRIKNTITPKMINIEPKTVNIEIINEPSNNNDMDDDYKLLLNIIKKFNNTYSISNINNYIDERGTKPEIQSKLYNNFNKEKDDIEGMLSNIDNFNDFVKTLNNKQQKIIKEWNTTKKDNVFKERMRKKVRQVQFARLDNK